MPAQVKPKVTSLLSIQEITKGDEMPIGAWVAPPPADVDGIGNPNFITDKYYQLPKRLASTYYTVSMKISKDDRKMLLLP